LKLLDKFSESIPIPSFTNIISVGVELFHEDGRTDMMKL